MRLLFLFLFMLVSFIGKAQMLPINRTKIMRPIDPPRKTTCKFSDGIGKTIVVTKYIEGLDYNVYSKRLVNAASRGDVKAQFALWYLYYHGQGVAVDNAQFKQKQREVNMREMNCKWLRMSNIS